MFKSILCALLVANVAAPALAQDEGLPTRSVKYADLNLQTPRGIATLDRRVAAAISDMCGVSDERDWSAIRFERECRKASLASVANQRSTAIASANGNPAIMLAGR